MIAFEYIKTQAALDGLVADYQQASLLVLDTEFVRTRTYHAQLGLIQAYDGQRLALIDPLAVEDLSGFWQLLVDPTIVKVLHSCSEDLDVFARYGKVQPQPLIDSQLAAAFCGWGYGLGYGKLVEQQLEITLDKGESRTDWLKRPLSSAQLRYAANDVHYLYKLYPRILARLEALKRQSWIEEEGLRLTKGRLQEISPECAYLKVKNAFQLERQELAVLRELAAWRLQRAQEKDLALGFVVKDHALIALAKKQPQSMTQILKMTELTEQEKRFYAKNLLKLINQGLAVSAEHFPAQIDVTALKPGYKGLFKELKAILLEICQREQIPEELFASKRHIHEYIEWRAGFKDRLPLLVQGWRGEFAKAKLAAVEVRL